MDKLTLHNQILEQIHAIYKAKNADYGDSFSQSVAKYGLIASMVRIGDKMNRLETLVANGNDKRLVADETIKDTLLDLAGYAIMTIMELERGD